MTADEPGRKGLPDAEAIGLLRESNDGLGDLGALRHEMDEHGYVFVRGLVQGRALREAEGEFSALLEGAGWARRDERRRLRPLSTGARQAETLAASRAVQRALFCCEALHRLAHHPALLALAGRLLAEDQVLRHPRPVARVVFPASWNAVIPTPPHQDHLGMQGARETYTAWVAIENCTRREGAIAVSEGSHRLGLRAYQAVVGGRVFSCESEELEGSWRSSDFAPGDVLLFHSLTVHAALENTGETMRRSLDCRYQRVSDPVSEVSLREEGDLPWERVYADWRSDDLKRYWERLPLNVVPFDATYHLRDDHERRGRGLRGARL